MRTGDDKAEFLARAPDLGDAAAFGPRQRDRSHVRRAVLARDPGLVAATSP